MSNAKKIKWDKVNNNYAGVIGSNASPDEPLLVPALTITAQRDGVNVHMTINKILSENLLFEAVIFLIEKNNKVNFGISIGDTVEVGRADIIYHQKSTANAIANIERDIQQIKKKLTQS